MIHLVLYADREQSFRANFKSRAFEIEGVHCDALGARDSLEYSGKRKAAFFDLGYTFGVREDRIDQGLQIALILAHVDNDHLLMHINLCG